MNDKLAQGFYVIAIVMLTACNTGSHQQNATHTDSLIDNSYTHELTEQLQPIRNNTSSINSIADSQWTSVFTTKLWETTEGGEATYYGKDGILRKVVVNEYGETGKLHTEYYLQNEDLSFVLEQTYNYNIPIDDTSLNFEESETIEDSSYFQNGQLIHQSSNQDCGAPFAEEYLLEEQKRIRKNYMALVDSLVKMTTYK